MIHLGDFFRFLSDVPFIIFMNIKCQWDFLVYSDWAPWTGRANV